MSSNAWGFEEPGASGIPGGKVSGEGGGVCKGPAVDVWLLGGRVQVAQPCWS